MHYDCCHVFVLMEKTVSDQSRNAPSRFYCL